PRNGKEMEVAALSVLKEVLRLHSWLECVNESLRGYRHLLGNLRRINGVGRRSIPAGISNQRQQPDNAYQQRQTSKTVHCDPSQKSMECTLTAKSPLLGWCQRELDFHFGRTDEADCSILGCRGHTTSTARVSWPSPGEKREEVFGSHSV